MTISLAGRRIQREWRSKGAWRTLLFLFSRVIRHWNTVVYEADLELPRTPSEWNPDELLESFGSDNIDSAITAVLAAFLGADGADNLDGVRNGNHLFLISARGTFLHCGYILYETRQTKLIGEPDGQPVIACCFTSPAARGRGLFRRALNAELCFLRDHGYKRAVIETHPDNSASRKGIESAGFRSIRVVHAWILLNRFVLQRRVETSGARWKIVVV